jgi:hypothetical protein
VTFGHDTEHALATVVHLVNTDPEFGGREGLPDVETLQRFVVEQRISHADSLTVRDVLAVQRVRRHLGTLFGIDGQELAARLANELLTPAKVQPRLTNHDGYAWHIHYFAPGASLAEHLAVDGGMALAHVIAADEIDRLRICEAPTCQAVLLDLSRNRSKRYCDASTCGNRLHVAAYRERKRSQLLTGRG